MVKLLQSTNKPYQSNRLRSQREKRGNFQKKTSSSFSVHQSSFLSSFSILERGERGASQKTTFRLNGFFSPDRDEEDEDNHGVLISQA
ncbi:hypothetical protein EUTSA_v10026686mg [Eutrema salsugineum]|uniref:Uncharacterized protein n=1 Tax=Eutrema salsugineum TaxID=72664 RepID=V4MHB2_EUTSA|nr:hypothetical protein EUTSA_v10026686mg [Eutrema salsugineum]